MASQFLGTFCYVVQWWCSWLRMRLNGVNIQHRMQLLQKSAKQCQIMLEILLHSSSIMIMDWIHCSLLNLLWNRRILHYVAYFIFVLCFGCFKAMDLGSAFALLTHILIAWNHTKGDSFVFYLAVQSDICSACCFSEGSDSELRLSSLTAAMFNSYNCLLSSGLFCMFMHSSPSVAQYVDFHWLPLETFLILIILHTVNDCELGSRNGAVKSSIDRLFELFKNYYKVKYITAPTCQTFVRERL